MNIKEFFAVLGLDLDEKAFAKGDAALSKIDKGLKLLRVGAIAAGGALVAATIRLGHHADGLLDTKAKTGIAVEALQELEHAANKSGSSAEGLGAGLRGLGKNLKAAVDGNEEAQAAFSSLGVSIYDASGQIKPADVLLEEFADRFKEMPDGLMKSAKAQSVFGKAGADLIPLLNEGAEGIRTLREEAHDLGLVVEDAGIKSSKRFWDALTRLKDAAIGLGNVLVVPFMDIIADGMELALRVAKGLIAAIKFLTRNVRLLAIVIGTVLLTALAMNIKFLIFAAHYYAVVGTAAVVAGAKAAAAWVAATWPVIVLGLAIGALLLILEDLWVALEGGESFLGKLFDKINAWLDDLMKPKPGDHWLLAMFKEIGAVFVGTEGAWDRFLPKLQKGLRMIAPLLTFINPALGGAAAMLGFAPRELPGGASSPGASVQTSAPASPLIRSPLQNHTALPPINAPVTVNVPANVGTPQEVGTAVERAIRLAWDKNMRDAASAAAIP